MKIADAQRVARAQQERPFSFSLAAWFNGVTLFVFAVVGRTIVRRERSAPAP